MEYLSALIADRMCKNEIIREDKSAEPSGEEQAAGAQAEAGPSAEAGKPGEDGISGEAGVAEETGNAEENGGAQNAAAEGAAQTDTDLQEPTEEDLEDLLEYVDAWQVHHTMRVDSKVAKNVYDSDKFEHVSGDVTKLLYHDENYEVLQGIDVCDYKGEIDWKAVSDAGYSFVFVRVGFRGYGREGSLNEDAKAVDYLREAKEAGLEVGTYFFSQAVSEEEAREETAKNVAVPGSSEHEAGLAADIVYARYQSLDESQENNATQQWLMEHCQDYGFILRYPRDKQDITGITYEPWHYRYVGYEAAEEIMSRGICLEEYLGQIDGDGSFEALDSDEW